MTIDDGKLVIADRPDPSPSSTELLVAVEAAGINAADLLQKRGRYPAPPGSPADIPGLELAGTVVSAGERVSRFVPGEKVMAVVAGGAQAELALVEESHALAVPGSLGIQEAGGFPEAFSTAHDALFTQCGLIPGDRVLITGAAGGVGCAAVQLAARAGAVVVASVRRAELHSAVSDLGAEVVIQPDSPEELAKHGPFDIILELVGAPRMAEELEVLAIGGRVAVIGVGAGARMELDLRSLMSHRSKILAATLRARSVLEKAAVASAVSHQVLPLVERGDLRVPIAATYNLEEAALAYERFAQGGKLGKIVLTTSTS